jgi:DNA-binding SARP family transcriptional activator
VIPLYTGQPIKVTLLGDFSLTCGDKTLIEPNSTENKSWRMLKYLVARGGRPVHRDELIAVLWQKETDEDAIVALRTRLSRLRDVVAQLGAAPRDDVILYRLKQFRWNPEIKIETDADLFTELYKKALYEKTDDRQSLSDCLKAMELYKGDFLRNSLDEPWTERPRAQYRTQYVRLATEAIRILEQEGRHEELAEVCTQALEQCPFETGLHKSLIAALCDCGREKEAHAHYRYLSEYYWKIIGKNAVKLLEELRNNAESDER